MKKQSIPKIVIVKKVKYIQVTANKGCRSCDIPKETDCASIGCGGYIYKKLTWFSHLKYTLSNIFKRG